MSVTINASGAYSVKRAPELANLNLRISAERPTASDALEAVRSTSSDISATIRNLAAPKSEVSAAIGSEELDIDDQARDPAFPVTSWSMQQLRTWSVTPAVDDKPRPPPHQARMMTMVEEEVQEEKVKKVFHAETYISVTFHDFAKLSAFIETTTTNDIVSIDGVDWEVTRATRKALQTRVRQGAYADALAKAIDYAAAIAPNVTPRATEVHDDSMTHVRGRAYGAQPVMRMMDAGGGRAEAMTFEPEPIEISAQVRVAFALNL
ncbi:hypothetical protein CcaverHIS002_0601130 [Cutaneotrichosporon cavernicola]|uniref:SIMPL domain-containing protein n=1 Tax=Cutaneotrichosporon cavernicola TaxID=279322 RepID=A0AA48L5V6_9TREE|nr:uncharacterized protein CcaverHIS019_0501230 [Cutaneotrichosporon cavernicola]BEI85826.1 hypothetical protein CcaverHIS002_0601130 [Cutaneotrichosporon cavernicola]BEI92495.1 hypothetical protein CcaverHIS019_0501230 [Cutaneotrichosporon cavernicola]BEJ00267.1 hypothetical protein CcaverHIS631_0501240 [Cutaneotrichosporon cavernicola]BEJ08037.1 hypothetical protein CcaverHIS641_0501220 [Cutaneotrichosporon cavernicola]